MISLRARVKKTPAAQERIICDTTDPALNASDQVSLDKRLDAELVHWVTNADQFEDNWAKAFGLIYEQYFLKEIQCSIR